MSKRLGKAIKEKRELLGYSQDALAFELNVTQAYISLIEKEIGRASCRERV